MPRPTFRPWFSGSNKQPPDWATWTRRLPPPSGGRDPRRTGAQLRCREMHNFAPLTARWIKALLRVYRLLMIAKCVGSVLPIADHAKVDEACRQFVRGSL